MRNVPKNYHDENYYDPIPAGRCAMCGEPIFPGDPCYELYDGRMFHADQIYRIYRETDQRKTIMMSCAMAYAWDDASQDEILESLGMEKKIWV